MELNAKLDVDLVAVESEDEVTCLLRLEAPIPPEVHDRPGETLIVVVDRSGSMSGERLESVRAALHTLVGRLKPQDTFGIVKFDGEAQVQVPARPMAQHHIDHVRGLIDALQPGGSTDLSAGYLLGLSEARRRASSTGASIVLLSDGHANSGIVDPIQLGEVAAKGRQDGITTSTIGLGEGYDESLLSEIAVRATGSHRFALTADDAVATLGEEAGDLLSKAILNAVLRIRPTNPSLIAGISSFQALRSWVEEDDEGRPVLVVALGDFYAGEQREILLRIQVPALHSLGLHHLADLGIEYVALPDLAEQTITWPLAVNAVPGDQAAGRIPDPTVTTARLLAETTEAKRQAAKALNSGDTDSAVRSLEAQAEYLSQRWAALDPADSTTQELRDRLAEEEAQVRKLARGAKERDLMYSSKSLMEDIAMESTGRSDQMRRTRAREKRDF